METQELGPYQKAFLAHWEQWMEASTEALQTSFKAIIAEVNKKKAGTLKGLLVRAVGNDKTIVRKIELWHGAWEFDFTVQYLDKHEDIIGEEDYENKLFPSYDSFPGKGIYNLHYPEDCDVYLEEHRESLLYREKFQRFFIWLASNWIACGGHRIGVCTTTEENSVRRIFNLNHLNWSDFVTEKELHDSSYYNCPIKRELTPFELESRVRMDALPAFRTRFRYLEMDGSFVEFAIYNYKVHLREGGKEQFASLPFTEQEMKLTGMCQQIDGLLNKGYQEVPRPNGGPKLHPDLVEWQCDTYRSNKEKVAAEEFQQLESNIGYTLPSSYKWFMKWMNHQDYISGMDHVKVAFEDWRKIENLVKVEEMVDALINLHKDHQLDTKLFPFARCAEEQILLMNHETEEVFLMGAQGQTHLLYSNFQSFLNHTASIESYFCPRRVHLEKGNAEIVRRWIENGWDMKDVKPLGSRSILQISYSDEVNSQLVRNGADPNELYLYGDIISREYLELLIEHGLDFSKKLEESQGLRKMMAKRGLFDDLLEKY